MSRIYRRRYTVKNRFTGKMIIQDGTSVECAEAIGYSVRSFYTKASRCTHGIMDKWEITGGSNYQPHPEAAYTVYDNRTDLPVIIDGTAEQAARAMGITLKSFYSTVTRSRQGKNRRWHISTIPYKELDQELEDI